MKPLSKNILDNDPYGKPRSQKCIYRAVFGCLRLYNVMFRPYITMATQQCTRYWNSPSRDHEESVKRIFRYILKNKDKGLVLSPEKIVVWSFMLMLIGYGRGRIDWEMTRPRHIPGLDTSSCFPVFQLCGFPRCNLWYHLVQLNLKELCFI